MAPLHDFLTTHGPDLLGAQTDATDLTRRFFDPNAAVQPASRFNPDALPKALASALDASLEAAYQKGPKTRDERLALVSALQKRASGLTAAPATAVELSEDVIDLLNLIMHDLRSPLVTIRGYVEMSLKQALGPTTPAQERGMRVALRNSIALDDMIETLLNFSRLQQGRIAVVPRAVPMARLLTRATATFEEVAAQRETTFEVVADGTEDLSVLGSLDYLCRALRILLDNALKFTRQGTVVLRVVRNGDELRFSIEDTGPGIDPALQARIFEPLFKITQEGHTKGAGLGLTVARALIQAHGAELVMDSKLGAGTTVSFSLPVAGAPH